MKPVLYVAALSLLMSLPAQAYEVETGPVMLCDTQQQAERFVQHFAGNQEAAIGAVNAEEHNPRACAIVEVAYVQGEPLGIEPQLEPKLAGGPFDAEALAAGLGDNVLLVGHDPDFSMAVHALTGAQVRLKKGGLAGVEKGELKTLLRPDELAVMAG